jgi:hypothetical protein
MLRYLSLVLLQSLELLRPEAEVNGISATIRGYNYEVLLEREDGCGGQYHTRYFTSNQQPIGVHVFQGGYVSILCSDGVEYTYCRTAMGGFREVRGSACSEFTKYWTVL